MMLNIRVLTSPLATLYGGLQAERRRRQQQRQRQLMESMTTATADRPWAFCNTVPSQPLSRRRVSSAAVTVVVAVGPHLVPAAVGLSVQDGAQAPEAGVRTHLDAVDGRVSRLRGRRRRVDGTHVVGGFVRPSPPEVSQVGEAQLLWLQ